MDDFIRRVIAQDDAVRRDFDLWQHQHQRRKQQQQEREQREAALAREQLVVRQWLAQSRGEVQTTDFLDARNDDVRNDEGGNSGTGNDAAWNAWARSIAYEEARTVAADLAHIIGAEVGKLQQKQAADFQDQIDAIKAELSDVRAEIADLRSLIDNEDRSTVVPMLALKGGRHVA